MTLHGDDDDAWWNGHATMAMACSFAVGGIARHVGPALTIATVVECLAAHLAGVQLGWMIVVVALATCAGSMLRSHRPRGLRAATTLAIVAIADVLMSGVAASTSASGAPLGLLAATAVLCVVALACYAVSDVPLAPAFCGVAGVLAVGLVVGPFVRSAPVHVSVSILIAVACATPTSAGWRRSPRRA